MTHAVELVFGACFVSSAKGQTESYIEQQSLGYTSHIWDLTFYSGSSIMKKNIPPFTIERKVIYQELQRNSLGIPHLSSISINIHTEQSNKSYLLSETLFCVHEETGNFMRPIDFS